MNLWPLLALSVHTRATIARESCGVPTTDAQRAAYRSTYTPFEDAWLKLGPAELRRLRFLRWAMREVEGTILAVTGSTRAIVVPHVTECTGCSVCALWLDAKDAAAFHKKAPESHPFVGFEVAPWKCKTCGRGPDDHA